jgi:hypothetical protein
MRLCVAGGAGALFDKVVRIGKGCVGGGLLGSFWLRHLLWWRGELGVALAPVGWFEGSFGERLAAWRGEAAPGSSLSPLRRPLGRAGSGILEIFGPALRSRGRPWQSDAVGRVCPFPLGTGAQAESLILAQNERWRRA